MIARSEEDREITAFRFGQRRAGGILLVSLIHACEWVGALACLRTAENVLSLDPSMPLTLLPVMNPDGADRAHRDVQRLRPAFRRGNARGVDLNRNFPPTHRVDGIWSSMPWYRPGSAPASERETRAVIELVERDAPRCSVSFHSFGRWIFYPPASSARGGEIAGRHADIIERAGGARSIHYRSAQLARWAFWFRAFGSEIDHIAARKGSYAYLVEVTRGGIGRWAPPRCFLPFFLYNPPRPEPEIERVAAFCARLARLAVEEG